MGDQSKRGEAEVKVAVIQMEPTVGRKEENVARTAELIETAAGEGARLVVLPELCNSGYVKTSSPALAGTVCRRGYRSSGDATTT